MKKLIALVLCILASLSASAATETNKTINAMGVQIGSANSIAYVYVSPALAVNCLYGILYIQDLSTPGGTALLSMLQKAYSLSKPLSRIDYAQDSSSGMCFINLIEVAK
jgi:hypothetical protein